MKAKIFLILTALFFIPATSYADGVPGIIIDGLKAYKASGFNEAFNMWLKGSPLESDKTTATSLKAGFTQIETMYGKMTGYEVLKFVRISTSTNRTYAVIHYEKGPLFVLFDCYKTEKGWIIALMRFHTDADKILPDDVFSMK